ncbi:hypothetical protein Tco_1028217 [Tanacetum coccineum]|uniref:Uncharacterized protein n=1 Tax=Tanacetum coccineum TaxID=301880 RepID=A0ABQ5FZZ4_9ASTR
MPRKKFHVLAQHLQEVMEESLPEMEDVRSQADVAKMIIDAIQQERENLRVEISSQINNAMTNHIPSQVDSSIRNYMSSHILHVHPTQASSLLDLLMRLADVVDVVGLIVVVDVVEVAQIRHIFLDGYGVLDVRTVFFKCLRLSSRIRAF